MGPDNDHAFANELLRHDSPPSRWYLTGVLVPSDAPVEQKSDETSTDEIDSGDDKGGTDDTAPPDRAAAQKSWLPSSMGLSVLVAPGVESLEAIVEWGDYVYETDGKAAEPDDKGSNPEEPPSALAEGKAEYEIKAEDDDGKKRGYRRVPRQEKLTLTLPKPGQKVQPTSVPKSDGLHVVVTVRVVTAEGYRSQRLPRGTRSVSVFVVNNRKPNEEHRYRAFVFQAKLRLVSPKPFVGRPDPRGALGGGLADEWDEQVADLQYRDVVEYAVGHGVSAMAQRKPVLKGVR